MAAERDCTGGLDEVVGTGGPEPTGPTRKRKGPSERLTQR